MLVPTSLAAASGRQLGGDDALGCGDRGIDGGAPHIGQGLRLGAGDLVLGELGSALEMFLHRDPRLGGERLRFFGGEAHDRRTSLLDRTPASCDNRQARFCASSRKRRASSSSLAIEAERASSAVASFLCTPR